MKTCQKKPAKWLKKYTKLEYLPNILETHSLYLGDPKTWDDENDLYLLELYRQKKGLKDIRVLSLTSSEDRFHFWDIFGDRELGVCLWFDRNKLIADIEGDITLKHGNVRYLSPKKTRDQAT